MRKTMSKVLLDKAIEKARHYYDVSLPFDDKDVGEFMDLSNAVSDQLGLCIFSNLLASIFSYSGLKNDATNEDVYQVLEVLGWTVE